MSTLKRFLAFLIVLMFVGVSRAHAQEPERPRDFGAHVDSIVQSIFQSIDERLGTYIFLDEPNAVAAESDSLEETDEGLVAYHGKHSRYWRSRRESSLYAFAPHRGIMRNPSVNYPWELPEDEFIFRYNRVEGLFFGLNSPQRYFWQGHHVTLFGTGGYGFSAHRWRYSGGVAQQFGAGSRMLEVGVEGHSLTDTRDQWIINEGENTLAALFLHDDYRDYFG